VFGLTAQEAHEDFIQFNREVLEIEGISASHRTGRLKEYLEKLGRKRGISKALGMHIMAQNERSKHCKLYVPLFFIIIESTLTTQSVIPISYKQYAGSTCMIRNFGVREERGLDITVMDAIIFTLATPPLFSSTSFFKDAATFQYTSAELKFPNPIRQVFFEAYKAFGPDEDVACVLSLGCGRPGPKALPDDSNAASRNQSIDELLTNSEITARDMGLQMRDQEFYHRFSVTHGLESPPARILGIIFKVVIAPTLTAIVEGLIMTVCTFVIFSVLVIFLVFFLGYPSNGSQRAISSLSDAYALFFCASSLFLFTRMTFSFFARVYYVSGGRSPGGLAIIQDTSKVETYTQVYLADISFNQKEDLCVEAIKTRTGCIKLERLGE
jgi:hypothetical protein